jgi:hypothetical protein
LKVPSLAVAADSMVPLPKVPLAEFHAWIISSPNLLLFLFVAFFRSSNATKEEVRSTRRSSWSWWNDFWARWSHWNHGGCRWPPTALPSSSSGITGRPVALLERLMEITQEKDVDILDESLVKCVFFEAIWISRQWNKCWHCLSSYWIILTYFMFYFMDCSI